MGIATTNGASQADHFLQHWVSVLRFALQDTASVYSNEKIFFTPRRAKVPRDFGGKHPEAIFTALVAGIATYLMPTGDESREMRSWVNEVERTGRDGMVKGLGRHSHLFLMVSQE